MILLLSCFVPIKLWRICVFQLEIRKTFASGMKLSKDVKMLERNELSRRLAQIAVSARFRKTGDHWQGAVDRAVKWGETLSNSNNAGQTITHINAVCPIQVAEWRTGSSKCINSSSNNNSHTTTHPRHSHHHRLFFTSEVVSLNLSLILNFRTITKERQASILIWSSGPPHSHRQTRCKVHNSRCSDPR